MPTIHFLNVKLGACSVICHESGRVTVIDVCNAKPPDTWVDISNAFSAQRQRGENGNFQQKRYPVNTHNLTGYLVVLKSEASMRRFLRDRQRSVESKMRKAIKVGLRAGPPVADALISEMCLILALQKELEESHGT